MEDAASLERKGRELLERATTAAELEDARVEALGRSSALTLALRELGALPGRAARRARPGAEPRARRARAAARRRCASGSRRASSTSRCAPAAVDVTLPGDPVPRGTAHLLTQVQREIEDVFVGLGFRIAEGPEVELEYYNFTALNTPDDHPSKAESDTLWISPDVCLRTQTSPVQVRVMEQQPPPVYVICPGRVYRRDTLDATHSPMFQQVEGLAVDRGLSLAHLKGTLEHFARALFGPDREIRLRSHFFPFTEPSVELDVSCFLCGGAGCRVCKGEGWIEILGAGMVDPNVFGFVPGYDPEVVSRAGRSAWASSGSRCSSTASRTSRASTTTTCASSSSSAGPCDEGPAAMARRPPRRPLPPLDELVAAALARRATRSRASSAAACPAVDGIEELIVAGHVLEAGKHPNADRLQLTPGRRGRGASRARSCAAPGTSAPATRSPSRCPARCCSTAAASARSKLRGETSDGMILSERELDISHGGRGDHGARRRLAARRAARRARAARPRRARARGHLEPRRPALDARRRARRARDLRHRAAPLDDSEPPALGDRLTADWIAIAIEDEELCPRFTARVFQDVTIGPSPLWLKARLQAAGMRPISNVVDITNYVMHDLGSPLHAYDHARIRGATR